MSLEMRMLPSTRHSSIIAISHKEEDMGNTKLTSFVKFTPTTKKSKPRETLKKWIAWCVTVLQLKSLEPYLHLPRGTEIMLKNMCKDFKQDWLIDEVLNSVFFGSCKSLIHTSFIIMRHQLP